eukprot:CAMPEP_0113315498 /NCGR_PEP_ID=MMETSP0010_2-20120614/11142_1 /TAXON_ID=216773 ORGANISM="Corethron hystrix, Strain 308" /NCGR_SAMPLE_ID=MMETSP0010_2 /ASSEMBLY_ACC=CAM_ASM_000155 /LENGTH=69 /DNA_ID=CAMNT_0000172011 /DNA_START=245 /DNA_END=454 /DNA_ORIENTATION=+ /assembly_acc=CAM_ASM_000155
MSGGEYDDDDWDELPPSIQKAAIALGYNKIMWDTGVHAACEDKDWDELTKEEQDAATILGYDQKTWDAE